ncbi:carboxypeptidase regulatory-like domain-containing protein [Cellulomonas alba]|uniref:Carboxypeptidase regulatory-like domain-containing protein n=1 Tax=Cellulomonas alba TaxID=3053467 RepID=A0ABT7SK72_9CELL|nr:carboxypeptidase regulatory-like domain-containing protein [Cellulomonas alba]MDM7856588.1 carboxypeptidase regulatory-like domain-containing protein [Cellulomonas alba]
MSHRTAARLTALTAALLLGAPLLASPAGAADPVAQHITGTVTLKGVAEGLDDYELEVVAVPEGDTSGEHVVQAAVDDDGTYSLPVAPGRWWVRFVSCVVFDARYWDDPATSGSGPDAVTVEAGADTTGIDATLVPGARVVVHATAGGKPLAKAPTYVSGGTIDCWDDELPTTDAHGDATLAYVAAGPASPYVQATDTTLATWYGDTVRRPDARTVTLVDEKTSQVTIHAVSAARVAGYVKDTHGTPVVGVTVTATNLDRTGEAFGTTDKRGHYTLTGLAGGKVKVAVYRSGNRSAGAVVTARQGSTVGVKTLVPRAPGSGAIRVATSQRAPVVVLDSHGTQVMQKYTSASTHKATFTGLRSGTYRVVARGTNVSTKVAVRSGRTTSAGALRLPPSTSTTLDVRTPAGAHADVLYDVLDSYGTVAEFSDRTGSDGRAVFSLRPGRYTVVAYAVDESPYAVTTQAFTVHAGTPATAALTLRAGAAVTGKVVDAHGRPVAWAVVSVTSGGHTVSATAGLDGRYTVQGLTAGQRKLVVTDPYTGGYLTRGLVVTARTDATVTAPTLALRARAV